MKTLRPQRWMLYLALTLMVSCTRSVSLTVLQPAEFKLPDHIQKIAVIDRSKPSNGWINVLEGLITGEAIGQDRQSRYEAVEGLTESLQRTPRFKVIRTYIEMTGAKAGVNLPPPLPWTEIERICNEYQADAVVAIESFDSDNLSSCLKKERKNKDKEGKVTTEIYYAAEMNTSVTMGWRLYDPATRTIQDEFTTRDHLVSDATANTEQAALARLPQRVEVTRRVAFMGGRQYGMRIAPTYVQVNRNVYTRAKGYKTQMQQANRLVQGNEWKRAAEIWKKVDALAEQDRPKSAGRAAYNLAVAAEMEGYPELALDWARKSWTRYGNRNARGYILVLERRISDLKRVEDQMGQPKR